MDEKSLRKLEQRIARLEKAVFSDTQKQRVTKNTSKDFGGATGGVRLLISKKFFKTKQGLSEVRAALSENGYHYSKQAAHAALNYLTTKGGPLVSLREGGRKLYAERK